MKTTKEYHVFVDKQTRKIIGKTIDVPSSMEDRFEEYVKLYKEIL